MNTFLFGNAKNAAMAVARIAIMMALTVLVQYLVGLLKIQLMIGSFVNLFLLLSAMLTGLIGGIAVGFVTPFIGLLIGIAPNIALVPFIAVSNAAFVTIFSLCNYWFKLQSRKTELQKIVVLVISVVISAAVKFALMYFFAKIIVPLFAADKIVEQVATTWGVIQLFTALIGGAAATALYYPLRAAKLITPAAAE